MVRYLELFLSGFGRGSYGGAFSLELALGREAFLREESLFATNAAPIANAASA